MLLIVSRRKNYSRELSNILGTVGILSYPVSATEALSEISPLYRAVVVIEPSFLYDAESFIESIRRYVGNMPVFALYYEKIGKESVYFNHAFLDNIFSETFLLVTQKHLEGLKLNSLGDYKLAGIDASVDKSSVLCFDESVELTKTETKILRFLIRSYPIPRSCQSIIKYLYAPTKAPEPSSIRTHVCKINAKFKDIYPETLICSYCGEGYIINTPELREGFKTNEKQG
jgi:hypothetical protein